MSKKAIEQFDRLVEGKTEEELQVIIHEVESFVAKRKQKQVLESKPYQKEYDELLERTTKILEGLDFGTTKIELEFPVTMKPFSFGGLKFPNAGEIFCSLQKI
jgi:hypothetical protein